MQGTPSLKKQRGDGNPHSFGAWGLRKCRSLCLKCPSLPSSLGRSSPSHEGHFLKKASKLFSVELIAMTSSLGVVIPSLSSLPSLEFPEGRGHIRLTRTASRRPAQGLGCRGAQ